MILEKNHESKELSDYLVALKENDNKTIKKYEESRCYTAYSRRQGILQSIETENEKAFNYLYDKINKIEEQLDNLLFLSALSYPESLKFILPKIEKIHDFNVIKSIIKMKDKSLLKIALEKFDITKSVSKVFIKEAVLTNKKEILKEILNNEIVKEVATDEMLFLLALEENNENLINKLIKKDLNIEKYLNDILFLLTKNNNNILIKNLLNKQDLTKLNLTFEIINIIIENDNKEIMELLITKNVKIVEMIYKEALNKAIEINNYGMAEVLLNNRLRLVK